MRVLRSPFHYLAGFITAAAALVSWVLVLVGAAIFCLYELNEDRWLRDEAYKDIREFMVGFFVATGGLICMEIFTRFWQ
jgi:hypothetical protein